MHFRVLLTLFHLEGGVHGKMQDQKKKKEKDPQLMISYRFVLQMKPVEAKIGEIEAP